MDRYGSRQSDAHIRLPWIHLVTALLLPGLCAAAAPPESKDPQVLTLVTYNVLADQVALAERIPPLMKLLAETDADVIALQEVDTWFLDKLARQPWIKRYQGTRIEGETQAPGGQYILSKFPIEKSYFQVLPGKQQRTVLLADLRIGGRTLRVATTHMESYLEDGPVRAQQLEAIFKLLEDDGDAVLMGDLNFGDGEQPETAHLDPRYVDMWTALKPNQPGFTWNIEISDMAKKGSFPKEPSRRIDRILIRSDDWSPKAIRIIGDKPVHPISKDLFPSDHFGLIGSVQRKTQ